MNLRDYQTECVEAVMLELSSNRSTLVVLPTGCGKTVVFGCIASQWETGRVLILAHREELIFQAAEKVAAITGEQPAIEMADLRADTADGWLDKARIVIASVQSMNAGPRCKACMCLTCSGKGEQDTWDADAEEETKTNCGACAGKGFLPGCDKCISGRILRVMEYKPEEFGLIITDEAHHATSKSYRRIFDWFGRNPNLKHLGVTATPDRADEEALGKVFETVAYNYELSTAIQQGYLVPIDQRFVQVDGLDFSSIRTTAWDLNAGDLEDVMLAEKPLHGIVGPTLELVGDRPTLIFTVSVAHAERVAEIINRHRTGSAVSLHGKTDSEARREALLRFKRREFQFLVNCGLFLEGFDETSIACVANARPTKSRALYAQCIGRGTRPHPPGMIDQPDFQADDRCERIACGAKPDLLVLDFVGNAGRHKLISAADILGGNYDDTVIEKAKERAKDKAAKGEPNSIMQELLAAQKEQEAEEHRRRAMVRAKATFQTTKVNPFDVFDMTPGREPGWHKGRLPTDRMTEVLKKNGIDTNGMTFWGAKQLLDKIFERRDQGKCTFKQAKTLGKYGYDTEMSFEDANRTISALVANNWKKPVGAPA